MLTQVNSETGEVEVIKQIDARLLKPADAGISEWGEGKTKSEFKDDANPTMLMAAIAKHEMRQEDVANMLNGAKGAPKYVDLTVLPEDYKASLDLMNRVSDVFNNQLDAKQRLSYDNDPVKYLKALEDKRDAAIQAQKDAEAAAADLAAKELQARVDAVSEPTATQTPAPEGG